jgi:hypothetical protein
MLRSTLAIVQDIFDTQIHDVLGAGCTNTFRRVVVILTDFYRFLILILVGTVGLEPVTF